MPRGVGSTDQPPEFHRNSAETGSAVEQVVCIEGAFVQRSP